jgi:hypothetical protein
LPRSHEEPFKVVGTGSAGKQMGSDARVPSRRFGPGLVVEDEFHVDVKESEGFVAPNVAGFCLEEAVEL